MNNFKKLFLVLSFIFLGSVSVTAQIVGDIDETFNAIDLGFGEYTGANSRIYTAVEQPDGKILIGGNFTTYNNISKIRIARLNADGSLDSTFKPGTGIAASAGTASVRKIALQSDGKILVGGLFTSYNGIARNRIVRLNADGSLDTTFNPGTGTSTTSTHYIQSIAIQPDGKILIGGLFTSYNGTTVSRIARLNANGSLDATFTGTGTSTTAAHFVYDIALQTDGKILIGGSFTSYNGTALYAFARLKPDGSLDSSFSNGIGSINTVYKVAVQADGKILVGGAFTTYQGVSKGRLVRLDANGALDTTFNVSGTAANTGSVFAIKVQSSGKILVGGTFAQFNGISRPGLTRLNTDGTVDTSFTVGTATSASEVSNFEFTSDTGILAAGAFTTYNFTPQKYISKLKDNGVVDYTFNPQLGATGTVYSTQRLDNGKLVLGGFFTHINGIERRNLALLNSDGSLDTAFNATGSGTSGTGIIQTVYIQPDGKILIGGYFTAYNDVPRNGIARVNADGSLDTTFNPGTGVNSGKRINAFRIQPDGKIIAAGDIDSFNGVATKGIIRLNNDGSVDNSFNTGGAGVSNYGSIYAIDLQTDGKVLIAGDFTTFNGLTAASFARLNADGTFDNAFGTNVGTGISIFGNPTQAYSVIVRADGKILLGGLLDKYNGTTLTTSTSSINRNSIALINPDGTLDASFSTGNGMGFYPVYVMKLQPDGKILVGGDFITYDGYSVNRFCRANPDGSLDTSFHTGIGAAATVHDITLQYEKKIIISGDFTSYNGIGRNRVASIYGDACLTATETDTAHSICAGDSFTWIDGHTYTESNDTTTYLVAGGSAAGCDVLKKINLTVLPAINSNVTVSGNVLTADLSGAVYQWLDCDSANAPIAGATSQSYMPTHSGNYAVKITVGSCSNISICKSVEVLGIGDIKLSDNLTIYPNPANDFIMVEYAGKGEYYLNDISGKSLQKGNLNDRVTNINISKLIRGIYILKITDNKGNSAVRKIIKE